MIERENPTKAEPTSLVSVELPRSLRSMPPAAPSSLRTVASLERRFAGVHPTGISRLTMDIELGNRSEIVTIVREGAGLRLTSTDGLGEISPFAQAALAWLDGAVDEGAFRRDEVRVSLAPVPRDSAHTELLLAISRGGVRAGGLVNQALSRWVGERPPELRSRAGFLLRAALEVGDPDTCARILAFCDVPGRRQPVVDRTFVELGRESLDGFESKLERRYLFDLSSGEIAMEERHGAVQASVGPHGRVLVVGYGEMEEGVPQRLHVSQYTVLASPTGNELDRVLEGAEGIEACAQHALANARVGVVEPIALVFGLEVHEGVALDAKGARIPLSRADEGALDYLLALAAQVPVRWLLGRWQRTRGTLSLVPLACAHRREDHWRLVRLR